MQRVQDRVSTALLRDVEAEVDTVEAAAGAAAVRVQADGADDETTMQVDVAPALHNRGLEQQAPLFTITTPLPLVKSKLLKYDRAALMRCVVANAHQVRHLFLFSFFPSFLPYSLTGVFLLIVLVPGLEIRK